MTDSPNVARAPMVFAADLGGTHLRAALIDHNGNIHRQLKQRTPGGDSAECVVEALLSAAQEFNAQGAMSAEVVAASIMVPGTVNGDNTTVVQAPNLSSLDNFRLKDALEAKLNWPVILENDANAAAIGEMWLGAARGYRSLICVTLGTGVGGGIVLDGKLWRGAHGSAGEIGHTTVDPFNGPKCKCGNTGCLVMFASATAIVRMAREDLANYPASSLDHETLTAQRIYEAGLKGDKLALSVFERVGKYLGVGLANFINLINPEVIVIGGGVANGWKLFEHDMNHQVQERAFAMAQRVKIVPAECGDNAGLLGAAKLGFGVRP